MSRTAAQRPTITRARELRLRSEAVRRFKLRRAYWWLFLARFRFLVCRLILPRLIDGRADNS